MTRKKRTYDDEQENLLFYLDDPNAQVLFSENGTVSIEYDDQEQRTINKNDDIDHFINAHNVYCILKEHCQEHGLFLEKITFTKFYDFIHSCKPISVPTNVQDPNNDEWTTVKRKFN